MIEITRMTEIDSRDKQKASRYAYLNASAKAVQRPIVFVSHGKWKHEEIPQHVPLSFLPPLPLYLRPQREITSFS